LAELRALQVQAHLQPYPLIVSGLVEATQVWRKGGVADWKGMKLFDRVARIAETDH
jgi:hypothetical protein